jgi:hypothetical protein
MLTLRLDHGVELEGCSHGSLAVRQEAESNAVLLFQSIPTHNTSRHYPQDSEKINVAGDIKLLGLDPALASMSKALKIPDRPKHRRT